MNDAPASLTDRPPSPLQLANREHEATMQAALTAAFEALPVPAARRLYKMMIPGLARQLTLMARLDPDVAVAKSARKKLVKVTHAAAALASMIDELSAEPPSTSMSVEWQAAAAAWSLLDRERRFQALNLSAELSDFAGGAKLPSARTKRGPPEKISAIKIATFLGVEFGKLTGEMPTRSTYEDHPSGQFVGLVTAVFTALRVRANPDQCARKAITAMKEKTPSSD
jgi:hypothetical protein